MPSSNKAWRFCSIFLACLLSGAVVLPAYKTVQAADKVRPPLVAGQFYPSEAGRLFQILDGFFSGAAPLEKPGSARAIIVPHAGYVYSGQVAASGFKALRPKLKRVFILSSSHSPSRTPFKFSLGDSDFFKTPLGQVRVSPLAKELLKNPLFSAAPDAQASHIIEVQLPFLQRLYSEFEIVPMVSGQVSSQDISSAAEILAGYLEQESAVVVSSDLSHYHPYDQAVKLDKACIKAIAALDLSETAKCEACALPVIKVVLEIARQKNWRAEILDYKNSGDTSGDRRRVVGYSSIAFYEQSAVNPDSSKIVADKDKTALLALAREAVESYVKTGRAFKPKPALSKALQQKAGCFVTLEKAHALRGCIGSIIGEKPLYECIAENAQNAARHDSRFPPVQPAELPQIEIEISVLTPPQPLKNEGPSKLLAALTPSKHGVILRQGSRSSTFLPQVWKQIPDAQEFLGALCRKAALPERCWQDPETEVLTYEALVFREESA